MSKNRNKNRESDNSLENNGTPLTEKETTSMDTSLEEERIRELESENQELKDKYLRLFAEFDNFKKRSLKEKIEMTKMAGQEVISSLLPVLDDFDRAKKNAEDPENEEYFSEGVELVYQKLYRILQQLGLQAMDTENVEFNPEFHDAIVDVEVQDEAQKGKIIDYIEKGYLLNDRIIRHAKVVVGKR